MKLKEKYNKLDERGKALARMLGILIIAVLLFVIILVAIAIGKGGKKTDAQIEMIMEKAAKSYVASHDDLFSDTIYGSKDIDVSTLVEEKYMSSLDRYYGKNANCSGKVSVYKNLDNYDYTAKINCETGYKTKTLYEEITDAKNIVTSESGLYEDTDKYVYRGEYVDNYVSFAGMKWRIINILKNGEMRIFQNESEEQTMWDDRYNSDYREIVGITTFEATESSRLKESILAIYNNDKVFTNKVKSHIIPKEYCVGKRSEYDTTKDYSTECAVKTELMGASTFVVADFLNASLDPKCNATLDVSCYNYNYMAQLKKSSWTMTADAQSTKKAYSFSDKIYNKAAMNFTTLRLVVTVNGNIKYVKGTGTYEDPYVIE